jgi:hypothetical protein
VVRMAILYELLTGRDRPRSVPDREGEDVEEPPRIGQPA